MNGLIINGSVREAGNTDIVLQYLKKGATTAKLQLKEVRLREKNIKNCDGCYKCIEAGYCVVQDDMSQIYEDLERSEILFFATPNYFCSVTGIMKTFLDRLFVYFHKKAKPRLEGKSAVLLITMNQKNEPKETKMIYNTFKVVLKNIGVSINEAVYFSEIMEKGAILKKPQYLKEAENLIPSLIKYYEKTATTD